MKADIDAKRDLDKEKKYYNGKYNATNWQDVELVLDVDNECIILSLQDIVDENSDIEEVVVSPNANKPKSANDD